MACLALSLQPVNGHDILLQTREWFPPARALVVLSAFRQTRFAFSGGKNSASDVADPALGDDPLSASSGQVIVGKESKYRVIYRLVNGIYVLGITTIDHDEIVNNVFECIEIVNQAVSVIVTACRGVDVTADKLAKKYVEIYVALDILLRGVSNIRLATILSSIHGEGIPKMVLSAFDSEGRVRGAEGWNQVEHVSTEHQASVEVFSRAIFELPPETLAAGDEYAATIAPAPQSSVGQAQPQQQEQPAEGAVEKDPFAASDKINKPEELAGGFKKTKDASSDLTVALAGLEVTNLPPAVATQSTFIGVEGFEGEYGGIEFGNEAATISEAFEGFDGAFGGGLDASEFVTTTKVGPRQLGLGGLEELQSGQGAAKSVSAATGAAAAGTPLDNLLVAKTEEMKGPELSISEEINAEFCDSVLVRVGLRGTVFLRTLPPKDSKDKETEFSFRLDGTDAVKRVAIQSSIVSGLGNRMFHVRTPPAEKPVGILKYSLQPHLTPLPLRVRLVKRLSGTLFSIMIQYVVNPELSEPIKDVTFVVKLPVDPTLLKVSPKAILSRSEKELRWNIQEVPLKGSPGHLRAQMPVDYPDEETARKEIEITGEVKFSMEGRKLSGISLSSITEGKVDFYEGRRRSTGITRSLVESWERRERSPNDDALTMSASSDSMWTQIGLAFLNLIDIILVSRLNVLVGIPDKVMVLGGSALADAVHQFKLMPFLIISGRLCPPGIEGTLFALFMSINNLGATLSSFLGAGLASALHIQSEAFDNLLLGNLIRLICSFIPIAFLFLIPKDAVLTC